MSLSIVNNNAQFSSDLPIFGRINYKSALLFAARPGRKAMIDLSGNGSIITMGQGAILADKGLVGMGASATDTGFKEPVTEELTVIVCARVYDMAVGQNNRGWLASSYATAPISGVGFLITADMVPGFTDRFLVKLRSYLTVTTAAGVLSSTFPTDITLAAELHATDTGYIYVALTINPVTKVVSASVRNKNLQTQRVYAPADNLSAAGRNAANGLDWKMCGTNGGSAPTAKTELQQLLIYGRALSDAEISRQFEDDKVWLQAARGITL